MRLLGESFAPEELNKVRHCPLQLSIDDTDMAHTLCRKALGCTASSDPTQRAGASDQR